MNNPLDRASFIPFANNPFANNQNMDNINNLQQMYQQALQNPQMFEAQLKQNNPQAYQYACQLRNSMSPQNAIMRIAQSRGINPNIFRMLGLG